MSTRIKTTTSLTEQRESRTGGLTMRPTPLRVVGICTHCRDSGKDWRVFRFVIGTSRCGHISYADWTWNRRWIPIAPGQWQ